MASPRSFVDGALAQGLPSLANFAAALWLVGRGGLAEFGVYSFLFTLSALVSAVQRPLVSLPMSVFAARSRTVDHYADFFTFHAVALVVGGLVATLAGLALDAPVAAFAAYVVAQQCREFVKSYLFSTHDRRRAMWTELVAAAAFVGTMGAFDVAGRLDAAGVLWAGAAGAATFFVPWARCRADLERRRRRRFRWRRYPGIWRFAKWSVAGALANEVGTRSYNYIVAASGAFELLGLINFVRQLYSPVQLLSSAWSQISLPVQREHYLAARHAAARRLRVTAQAGFAVVTLGWAAALALGMPLLHRWKPELDSPLMPALLVSWCLYYLVDGQLVLHVVEFHLRKRFRYLFTTGFACAVAMLAVAAPIVVWSDPEWLVAATVVLNVALLAAYVRELARLDATGDPVSPADTRTGVGAGGGADPDGKVPVTV